MNSSFPTKDILNHTLEIIRKTSGFIKSQLDKVHAEDVEEKVLNSLVSYVDKEAEKMLVDGLSKLLDDVGFITEEDTIATSRKKHMWIIDPLDGTTNFLNQVPHFCVSVALEVEGVIVMGIVKEVNSGEEWTAISGQGAYLNDDIIKVNKNSYNNVLIASGFPYSNDHDYDAHFVIIKQWLTNTRGFRRMGSAALDLCYVACGRFGAYYESKLNPWDVAAGILIVKEAGGVLSDFQGGNSYFSGREIIASSPQV